MRQKLNSSDKFQSAPLTEARGDLIEVKIDDWFNHVSIRSPHRSEGRLGSKLYQVTSIQVSIRSPHRSEGRHIAAR